MSDRRDGEAREGTRLMLSGVAIGLAGAASTLLPSATCPSCVVGAPALVGGGAYERHRASRAAGSASVPADRSARRAASSVTQVPEAASRRPYVLDVSTVETTHEET